MPIYEFYCERCHTVFNFLSRTMDTAKRPSCPRCNRPRLERRISRVAISQNRAEPGPDNAGLPDMDEAKMEGIMEQLARETEGCDENDPRQTARAMRKLYETSGMRLGGGMEEAISRMEAGESQEKIEEEMGAVLESEDPLLGNRGTMASLMRKLRPPQVDETLYDL